MEEKNEESISNDNSVKSQNAMQASSSEDSDADTGRNEVVSEDRSKRRRLSQRHSKSKSSNNRKEVVKVKNIISLKPALGSTYYEVTDAIFWTERR